MELVDKKTYSIGIIGCFFGKFPRYIDLWLKSCACNPTVDWLVFTDQELNNAPQNVHLIKMSLQDIRKLARNKLGFPIILNHPFKICDFRPAFGVVFEDYLKDYDFWGHCDFDMVFGDVRKFITTDILEAYEKVLRLGHLSLYRNTPEVNERYKLPGPAGAIGYKTAFCNERNYAFDELPTYEMYLHHHFPVYDECILLDIIFYHKHFYVFRFDNYPRQRRQVFFWEKGRIFRAYHEKGQVFQEEYIYIHFQKRGFDQYGFDRNTAEAFFITPDGFFEKQPGVIHMSDLKKYNRYLGFWYESFVMQRYFLKWRLNNIREWFISKRKQDFGE